MPPISEANKVLARTVAKAFGGQPQVTRYWDDAHESHVDMLISRDRPEEGVVSYSTICLSDHPLLLEGEEYETRLEMVAACGSSFKNFDRALATAAFQIINSQWFCFPGAIFPGVLEMYRCSATMRHFMFVPPFLWEGALVTLELPGKRVSWLLAVPIAESERHFAEARGADALEELFAAESIDVFDLERPPVV